MKNNRILVVIAIVFLGASSLSFGMNIWDAIYNNKVDRVRELIKDPNFDINEVDEECGLTNLSMACLCGNTDVVKELLKHKDIDVNKGGYEENAFYFACSLGRIDIVRILLEHKDIDVNEIDKHGQTQLYLACCDGRYIEVIKELLKYGATIQDDIIIKINKIRSKQIKFYMDEIKIKGSLYKGGKNKILDVKKVIVPLNLTKEFDFILEKQNNYFDFLNFIDKQKKEDSVFLSGRLYYKYGKVYKGIKESLDLRKDKIEKLSDCRIRTLE